MPKKKRHTSTTKKRKKRTKSKTSQKSHLDKTHKHPSSKKTKTHKAKKKRKIEQTKKASIIFDAIFFFFIVVMLSGAFFFFVSSKEDKSFFGYRFYEVLTNSMKKTQDNQKGNFEAGDMVIVKMKEPDEILVGDIITFVPNKKSKETYLTHRVIKKIPPRMTADNVEQNKPLPSFITKGDANNVEDPPVSGELVIGKVEVAIPKVGKIIRFIRSNLLMVIIFVTAFFFLLINLRLMIDNE